MRAHRVPPALACLALTVPAVARAMGAPSGEAVAILILGLVMLGASVMMLLALFVSLFVSSRSFTVATLVVGFVDVLAALLMLNSGLPIMGFPVGIAGGVLLVFGLLVGAGESMLEQTRQLKARPAAFPEAPPESSERAPD